MRLPFDNYKVFDTLSKFCATGEKTHHIISLVNGEFWTPHFGAKKKSLETEIYPNAITCKASRTIIARNICQEHKPGRDIF